MFVLYTMLMPGTLLYSCHTATAVSVCVAMKCRHLCLRTDLTTAVPYPFQAQARQCWNHSPGSAGGSMLPPVVLYKNAREASRGTEGLLLWPCFVTLIVDALLKGCTKLHC